MNLRTLIASILGYFVLATIATYFFLLAISVGGIQSVDLFDTVFAKVGAPFFLYAVVQSWLAIRKYVHPTQVVSSNGTSVRRLWAIICLFVVLVLVLYLSLAVVLPADTMKYL